MGSLKLPVIDFTKPELKPGTYEWDSAKRQVQQALQDFSCFEALFDMIPSEIREAMFGAMEELFDLPLEIKTRNVSEISSYGYIGQHPKLPFFESIGFEEADVIQKVEASTSTFWPQGNPNFSKTIQSFTKQFFESIGFEEADVIQKVEASTRTFWPQGNPNFSKTIQSFTKQLSDLDKMIRKMILEIFQVEKYMDEHMESTEYLLRVIKYDGPNSSDTQLGLGAHRDKSIVTILYQNEINGLEIQSNSGEWIDAKPSKDSFIVIIGESLQAWLNGRLKATYHRVMLSGDQPRYSLGLFTVPKVGYMIEVPEELVDEAHPLLYKPFDYVKYLEFSVTNIEQYPHTALEVFCGV